MIFDILFIFISTLSAIRCPQSTVYSPPSTAHQTSNPQIHTSFLKPYLSIIIFSLDEQRALRPLLNSVAKKFYEIRATNYDKLYKTNPITKRPKMNANKVLTKGYENIHLRRCAENKPNQTQYKPNQTQFSPSLCCATFSPAQAGGRRISLV